MSVASKRIGLVGCVKRKRTTSAPARDLYTSPLFKGRRRHVERTCTRWLILSAKHGLLDPAEVVAPYDQTLEAAPITARRLWAFRLLEALESRLGDLRGLTFEIHAGAEYRRHGLVSGVVERGAIVDVPTAGLSLGQQLAYYAGSGTAPARASPPAAGTPAGAAEPPVASRSHQSPASGGRYAPLARYLRAQPRRELTLSFRDLERILGWELPPSARRHRAWWSNSSAGHSHARGWLDAGCRVSRVDLDRALVTFAPTASVSGRRT